MQINEFGPIKLISLPEGWTELPAAQLPAGRVLREFAPTDQSGVKMAFFYRGEPISAEVGALFHKILTLAPHTLSTQELNCLKEILRERTDEDIFNVRKASTEDLNGKRVLLLIGTYKQTNNELYELFFDGDSTARSVYEIYVIGPTQAYRTHLKAAKPAIESIQWAEPAETSPATAMADSY